MQTTTVRRVLFTAVVFVATMLGTAERAWPHASTYHDINYQIFTGCYGCHNSNLGDGNLKPGTDEYGWRTALVNKRSGSSWKLRVHPYQPWNSFLLDKLTGDLKTNEGIPMPKGGRGHVYSCPGSIDEIYNWILAGAPEGNVFVPGDTEPFYVECDKPQPPLVAPAAPAGGYQVKGASFEVRQPVREAGKSSEVTLTNAAGAFVKKIVVTASAGTEYVTVTRKGDAAPLVVLRGQVDPRKPRYQPGHPLGPNPVSMTVALPAGVAVKLAPRQVLQIRQLIRNDFWLAPGTVANPGEEYANVTTGSVVVNLETVAASSVAHEATPFVDSTGTSVLFVPPHGVGATGGAWSAPQAPTGALVGLWTDSRAIRISVADAAGAAVVPPTVDVTRTYTAVNGGAGIAYECTHNNGATEQNGETESGELLAPYTSSTLRNEALGLPAPLRTGCAETASVPPGVPAATGEANASKDCDRSNAPSTNDCKGTGPEQCAPANLVGGNGVDDGRCALVGLYW
jgi:hypothetical protein